MHRPSTAAQVESNLRNHLYPILGGRPMGSLRPGEVQAWVKTLTDHGLAPATVELIYRYLVSIYRAAIDDRGVVGSPCHGVRLPKQEGHEVEPPSTEQISVLMDAITERYRALVVLGAGTGLRQGEAFGLSVDRVDFLRRSLRVDRQLLLLRGDPVFAPPKTKASDRTVPLPDVVLRALSDYLARFGEGPDRLFFTNMRGLPIRRTRFSDDWVPAARAAGLVPGTGFHVLRHYYASLLIQSGASVRTVQARLGHASATETLNTYSHLWPDSEDQTRSAVDSVLGSTVGLGWGWAHSQGQNSCSEA